MAWRFVKQPNGQLARFSEIIDDFTHLHFTEAQAKEYCIIEHLTPEEADRKIQRALEEPERWEEALRIIRGVHGEQGVRAVLKEHG